MSSRPSLVRTTSILSSRETTHTKQQPCARVRLHLVCQIDCGKHCSHFRFEQGNEDKPQTPADSRQQQQQQQQQQE
jgi:hypothetical protein